VDAGGVVAPADDRHAAAARAVLAALDVHEGQSVVLGQVLEKKKTLKLLFSL
jgi:hypothetical protein